MSLTRFSMWVARRGDLGISLSFQYYYQRTVTTSWRWPRSREVGVGSKQHLEVMSRPKAFPQLSTSYIRTVENAGTRETLLPPGRRSSQFLLGSSFPRHLQMKLGCEGTPFWKFWQIDSPRRPLLKQKGFHLLTLSMIQWYWRCQCFLCIISCLAKIWVNPNGVEITGGTF